MLETIGIILGIFLGIVGLVQVVRTVTLWFLRPHGKNAGILVVPIKGHNEEAELLLRSAAERVRWMSGGRPQAVVCMDCGMDSSTLAICASVCADYPFMELHHKQEVLDLLEAE